MNLFRQLNPALRRPSDRVRDPSRDNPLDALMGNHLPSVTALARADATQDNQDPDIFRVRDYHVDPLDDASFRYLSHFEKIRRLNMLAAEYFEWQEEQYIKKIAELHTANPSTPIEEICTELGKYLLPIPRAFLRDGTDGIESFLPLERVMTLRDRVQEAGYNFYQGDHSYYADGGGPMIERLIHHNETTAFHNALPDTEFDAREKASIALLIGHKVALRQLEFRDQRDAYTPLDRAWLKAYYPMAIAVREFLDPQLSEYLTDGALQSMAQTMPTPDNLPASKLKSKLHYLEEVLAWRKPATPDIPAFRSREVFASYRAELRRRASYWNPTWLSDYYESRTNPVFPPYHTGRMSLELMDHLIPLYFTSAEPLLLPDLQSLVLNKPYIPHPSTAQALQYGIRLVDYNEGQEYQRANRTELYEFITYNSEKLKSRRVPHRAGLYAFGHMYAESDTAPYYHGQFPSYIHTANMVGEPYSADMQLDSIT